MLFMSSFAVRPNLQAIKSLYLSDAAAKVIFNYFASRDRSPRNSETRLDQLIGELSSRGTRVSRSDAIRVLRALGNHGYGRFRTGRKGHPTRFEWGYSAIEVAEAAAGGTRVPAEIRTAERDVEDDPDSFGAERTLDHSFQLRPGWQIKLVLPADLTAREAARLSEFVKTLPFESGDQE